MGVRRQRIPSGGRWAVLVARRAARVVCCLLLGSCSSGGVGRQVLAGGANEPIAENNLGNIARACAAKYCSERDSLELWMGIEQPCSWALAYSESSPVSHKSVISSALSSLAAISGERGGGGGGMVGAAQQHEMMTLKDRGRSGSSSSSSSSSSSISSISGGSGREGMEMLESNKWSLSVVASLCTVMSGVGLMLGVTVGSTLGKRRRAYYPIA